MTLILDVPQEIEGRLQEKARRRGLALPEYAVQLLVRDADVEEFSPVDVVNTSARQAEIRALMTAPVAVRESVIQASVQAAAAYYQTEVGQSELADWRGLNGEDFHDD